MAGGGNTTEDTGDSDEDSSGLLGSIWDAVSSIPNKIQELATSVGEFFSSFWTNIGTFFQNIVDGITTIFNWLSNFFSALLDFVIHIFIPTDEQWESIKESYSDLGDAFLERLPFVGLFSEELEDAKSVVYNDDFLNITFESWSFDLGVIEFTTPEINFDGVLNAYEPYRLTIRSFLCFIVYSLGVVYIIKYVLRYGETQGNSYVVDKEGK